MAAPSQQARSCLQDSQQIFCNPQPYFIGAAIGATVCLLTGISNPFGGLFLGAPVLPLADFADRNLASLGNTTTAKIARWSLAVFCSLSIGTLFTVLCGFQVTAGLGALLVVSLSVSAVAFVSLAMGRQ